MSESRHSGNARRQWWLAFRRRISDALQGRAAALWVLTLVVVLLPIGCASRVVHDMVAVPEVLNLEIASAAGGAARGVFPQGPLPGPLLEARARTALPAQLVLGRSDVMRHVRYQIAIDAFVSAPDAWQEGESRHPGKALLLSQVLDGMDIYLNGVWIAGLPRSTDATRHKWHRPLVAPLARRLLKPEGGNLITVELSTWDSRLQLAPLYIGGIDSATTVFELIGLVGSSLANASNLLCLLAGLFLLGAGVASRGEGAVFHYAGALTVVWALLFWLVLLPDLPVAWLEAWQWAQHVCLGAVVALLTLFLRAFIDEPMSRRGRLALLAAALFAPLVFPWAGAGLRDGLLEYCLPVLLLFYFHATVRLARYAVRTRARSAFALLAVSILTQVMALHDHNVVAQVVQPAMPGSGWGLSHLLTTPMLLSHLTMPLLLLVTGQVLLARIQSQVRRIRSSNEILAETLAHRERELLVSYRRQRDMESEAAAQAERDRIYRELHDGIGSKLVTTLFSVRDRSLNHVQLEARLLESLADIREIISATDPGEERSIQDILFSYATSLDEALSGAAFMVEFDIEEGREVVLLGDLSRQVMRIVEETVANTVKYAQASRLQLSLRFDEQDALLLAIDDNGRGASVAAPARPMASVLSGGRGLAGMHARAHDMDGVFSFTLTPQGARTRLRLPLQPREQDPLANKAADHWSQSGEAASSLS